MTLSDLELQVDELKPNVVAFKFNEALKQLSEAVERDNHLAVTLINNGFFSDVVDMEADDTFGTEGMRL